MGDNEGRRTMEKRLIILAMAAGALLGAYGKTFSLDLRAPAKGGARPSLMASAQPHDDGTLRSFNLDAGVADVGEVSVGDVLTFTLFDDVALTLTLKEKTPSLLGGDAFLAEAEGYEGVKTAVVLRTADGLTIDVQDFRNKKYYKVLSTPDGVKVLEVEAKGAGRCGTCAGSVSSCGEGTALAPTAGNDEPRMARNQVPDESGATVDVLVAYDADAGSWAASNGGGIRSFAETAVQKMNLALSNSGISEQYFRFRLVGTYKVAGSAYKGGVSSGQLISDTLSAARNGAVLNGVSWAGVREKRDEVGADIVTVLIDTRTSTGTTGIGYSFTSDNQGFASYAYNCCAIRSVAQSDTMTHECGHNMGCGHSDIQADDPGPQCFPYSAGYYFSAGGEQYHTVMAYDTDGSSPVHYTGIPYFSNPDVSYKGVPTGNQTHDNARTIRQTYGNVLAFRTAMDANSEYEDESVDLGEYFGFFWRTSKSRPWTSVVYGGDALASGDFRWIGEGDIPNYPVDDYPAPDTGVTWLETTVTGPFRIGFCYANYMGSGPFKISVDGEVKFITAEARNLGEPVWTEVEIPEGEHSVRLTFVANDWFCSYNTYNGVELYDVRTDTPDSRPVISVQTDVGAGATKIFQDSCEVSITNALPGSVIYYILNDDVLSDMWMERWPGDDVDMASWPYWGDEPFTLTEDCKIYEGPFAVTNSTVVTAAALQPDGTLTIPARLSLRRYSAQDAGSLEWKYDVNLDGTIVITGVSSAVGYIDIPSEIDGRPVVGIGRKAFYESFDLIGVSIPEGVAGIDGLAFAYCYDLESVTIPASVTNIVESAFAGCSSLASVYIAEGNGVYSATNCLLCTRDGSEVIAYLGRCCGVALPGGVKRIWEGAFSHSLWLGSVTFNEGLEDIDYEAFWNCLALSSVATPSSLKRIGCGAFGACWNLQSVTLNEGLEIIEDQAFYGCPLKEVTLPSTIKEVPVSAFGDPDAEEGRTIRVNAPWSLWGTLESGSVGNTTINVVFYGEKPNLYSVILDVNGGNALPEVERTVMDGRALGPLPVPTKTGSDVFGGWYTSASGGDVVTAETVVTGDMTLYAHWEQLNDTYAKAKAVNGARGSAYGTNNGATADAGEFLRQKYGSSHTVWYKWTAPSNGLLRLEVTDADFDTVMGVFTGSSANNLNTIAYDDDGGEGGMSAVDLYVEEGVVYSIAVGGYDTLQGDFVLNWKLFADADLVQVTLDANGGTVDTASLRRMPGMAIGSLPWPEWQGHRFDGWFTKVDGGEPVDEYWMVPEDGATLYAHWTERLAWHTDSASALAEAKSTGKLIFFLSGRETCMNTIGTRDYTCEEPEVREALGDYVLWFCNCDTQGQDLWRYVGSSGSISLPFVCVINPYTNVPLVRSQGYLDADAVFSLLEAAGPAPGLNTVLLDANGGEVDEAERKIPSNFAVGELPTPTRLKYKFLGWFTEPEGGTKISASTKVNGNVTYYAHWEYDGSAPVNVSVASGCEGMGSVAGGNATFKVGAKVQLKATANRNHVFVGWYEDGRKIAEAASFTYVATGEEEVSLFAHFATAADDIASLKVNVDDVTAAADGAVSFDLAVCLSSLTPAKLSVSGLPSGVKYDAKTCLVSGRATKPGVYVVKVTATNASATGKNAVVQTFKLKVPNFTTDMFRAAGLDTDGQYVLDAGALPDALADVVDAATSGGWTLKIDGLPAGVKFDAKKGAFSGVATKEGFYTVTFTATKGSGKTAEKEIATATFEVAFPMLTIGIAACRNETATNACKVVGGGRYAVGAKVALKATPGKGNVFAGWFDAGGNPLAGAADYRTASFPYAATGADVTLTAKFATVAEDMEGLKVTVSDDTTEPDGTYELDLGGCVESLSMPKLAVKGLPTGLKFDAKTGLVKGRATKPGVYTVKVEATNTSVKKATSASAGEFRLTVPNFTSDVLPNLKPETDAYGVVRCGVIFDPSIVDCSPEDGWTVKAAGLPAGLKWDAKQNAITGVPTAKAGYYTVTFTATKGKEKEEATITLNVESLPAWAVGTFDGAVDGGGIVQALTVGANGKISGKVLEGGNSWVLSAASIGSYDEDSGAYLATVIGKAGKEIVTNMVTVTEGSDGSGIASSDEWTAYQNLWKRADTKASQTVFKKNIDVELDNGIKVTFKKDGVVAFAGNVDGSKVSGSSQLVWNGEGWRVTLYAPPAKTFVGFCETYVVTFSLDGAMTPSLVPME